MTGSKLRECLILGNVSITGLAEKLNMSQPNLSAQFKVQDVKTGILEKICDVLNVSFDFFYRDTKYLKSDSEKEDSTSYQGFVPGVNTCTKADVKDQEIIFLKGQVQALKETIKLLGAKNDGMVAVDSLRKINV